MATFRSLALLSHAQLTNFAGSSNGSPKAYSYSVTATDAAGNTSSATVVAGSDTN